MPAGPFDVTLILVKPSARTLVEVLRHAKACSRGAWDGSDESRPLADTGWVQTKHLVEAFAPLPVAAIYASPATRCVQTVDALAGVLGLPLHRDARLAGLRSPSVTDAGSPWPAIAWLGARALSLVNDAVAAHRGQRMIVCSHGDVLAALLASVAGRDDLPLTDVSLKKGERITLSFDPDGVCVGAQRVPPLPRHMQSFAQVSPNGQRGLNGHVRGLAYPGRAGESIVRGQALQ